MMGNNKYEQLLNECSKEYKIILEKYIERNNIESMVEIVKIDNKIKRTLMNDTIGNSRARLIIIELYTIMLLCMIFLIGSDISQNVYYILILLLALSFTQLINSINSNKTKIYKLSNDVDMINYEIIKSWRRIEGLTNDLKIKNKSGYLKDIMTIEYLSREKLINYEEEKNIKELLKIRNMIVHKNDIQIKTDEIDFILENAQNIINRLERILEI